MVIIAGSVNNETAIAIKEGAINSKLYIGRNIIIYGYHIHHYFFGILLIAVTGWLAIVGSTYLSKEKLAIFYGIGLGLFMDEIGMLLTEGDYYTSLSYLLGLLLLGILVIIVYFPPFWSSERNNVVDLKVFGSKYLKKFLNIIITIFDYLSSKIIKYKIAILIVITIFFIIDFLIPLIF